MSNGGDPTQQSIVIDLPAWTWEHVGDVFSSLDDRMGVILAMAERNIAEGGGPFAAGVFDLDGRLIAPGVNRVVLSAVPVAHAEIVAIAAAGQTLGTWDIGSTGSYQLVSSTEPCAMCLGAVPWSGVGHLVCGARDEDARAVGFDEGRKPDGWVDYLKSVGISVTQDVRRNEAAALMANYASGGGQIYNGAN